MACATALIMIAIGVMLLDRKSVEVPALLAPVTTVSLVNSDSEPLYDDGSRYSIAQDAADKASASPTTSPAPSPAPTPSSTPTATPSPASSGGGAPPAPGVTPASVETTPVPPSMELVFTKGTPAFTVAFPAAWDLLRWAQDNAEAKRFFGSMVFRGMLSQVFATLKVRPQDLSLEGMQGMTFEHFAGELLRANARLHYDRREGQRGFVFSFERAKSNTVSALLPILVPTIATRQFEVPSIVQPIVEVMIGSQPLLVAEEGGRIYIANGLRSLLRVLDDSDVEAPSAPEALTLIFRAEAFVDGLLPVFTGADSWDGKLVLTRGTEKNAPLKPALQLAGTKAFLHLSPKFSEGMFAAIPRDIFGVAAASFALTPEWSAEDWKRIGERGVSDVAGPVPETGGVALLWDLSGETEGGLSRVGLVIVAPKPKTPTEPKAAATREAKAKTEGGEDDGDVKEGDEAEADGIDFYATSGGFHGKCGNDSIWLLSSNELLLTRMRESCERQSTSFLTALEQNDFDRTMKESQLLVALNPGVGLHACYQVGLRARAADPDVVYTSTSSSSSDDGSTGLKVPVWKAAYEQAVVRITKESDDTFQSLPEVLFFGRSDPTNQKSGTTLPGILRSSGMSR